jgi:hypothetical protein
MPANVLVIDDIIATCHLLICCLAIIGVKAEMAQQSQDPQTHRASADQA